MHVLNTTTHCIIWLDLVVEIPFLMLVQEIISLGGAIMFQGSSLISSTTTSSNLLIVVLLYVATVCWPASGLVP